jgi:prephenate dehydratase
MVSSLQVAIQGEAGSFSEEAALGLLGEDIEVHSCHHFDEVFHLTISGECDRCLVPIENSLSGSIHRNYDLLRRHKLKIVGEVCLPVIHNLIVLPGVKLSDVDKVISHPVALSQCERFFEDHPDLQTSVSYDTAGSVIEIKEKNLRNWAAIASKRASDLFGGEIVLSGIQDHKENYTRFVLLAQQLEADPRANKTSIVFSFTNRPGALFKSLSVFALRDIDLLKIESRPHPGRPWEYLFYLDFLGNVQEERVRNALSHLGEITDLLEMLGCYPRDESVTKAGM